MGYYDNKGGGRSSGGGGGGFYGGQQKAAAKKGKAKDKPKGPKSLIGQTADVVGGMPRGLLHFGVGAVHDIATVPAGLAAAASGGKFDPMKINPEKGESFTEFFKRTRPTTAGLLESFGRTAHDVPQLVISAAPGGMKPSESEYGKASKEGRIVGKVVEDVANIAPVLKVGGRAASSAAGSAARAGVRGSATAARIAAGLEKAGRAAEVTADAPFLPYKLAMKVPRLAGAKLGLEAAMRAAEEGRAPGKMASALSRLSPESKAISDEILGGRAKEESLTDRQAARALSLTKILPDPHEQQAAIAVAEKTAPALAALRRHLDPDAFDKYVDERYRGTLTAQAAHLAADVAEGKVPDVAARIDQALAEGADGPGGRTERQDAFLAEPGRDWQAGYEPSAVAVAKATEAASAGLKKAQEAAEKARLRADAATARAAAAARPKLSEHDAALLDFQATSQHGVRQTLIEHGLPIGGWVKAGKPTTQFYEMYGELKAAIEDGLGQWEDLDLGDKTSAYAIRDHKTWLETLGRVRPGVAGPALARGRQEGRAHVLGNLARSAEARVARQEAKVRQAAANAANEVQNAPSRLRPALAENRAAASRLVEAANDLRSRGLNDAAAAVERSIDDLPQSLKDLEARGIDLEHFFHVAPGREAKAARTGPGGVSLPRVFEASSEKLRTGSPVYDRTLEGQFKGEKEALIADVRRETAERIAQVPGATEKLGQGKLAGARTAEDARALGYVPWNPASLFDTQGRVRRLDDIDAALGTEHPTTFMPAPLFEQFRNYFEPRKGETLGMFTDTANRVYYIGRLALSPGYITGQIFGNMTLALAGTSSPAALASGLREVVSSLRKGEGFPDGIDPRVLKSGSNAAEFARLTADVEGKGGKAAAVNRRLNSYLNLPFKAATFLDNTARAAHYLGELKVKGSPEAALEATLRSMGEFDKMSPFERDYVRRVIPMWSWHREVSKIAFHLAEDHPLRIAWTMHLGNTFGKEDGALPDFYDDSVGVGDKLVGLGQLFPHSQVGSMFGGGLLGVGKILGPVPKVVVGSTLQTNPSTGKPFSRPYGTGRGPGGQQPAAPSIATQAANLFPQKRLFDGLTGRNRVARYSTGEPIEVGPRGGPKKTIPSGQDRLTAISSFLGFPLYRREEIEAAAAAKEARDRKGAGTAPRRRRRSGGGGLYR